MMNLDLPSSIENASKKLTDAFNNASPRLSSLISLGGLECKGSSSIIFFGSRLKCFP